MDANSTNTTLLLSMDYYYAENSISASAADVNDTAAPSVSDLSNVSGTWKNECITLPPQGEVVSVIDFGFPDGTWNGSEYPSGYSQLRIIVTAFFVTFIMVVIVVGNMLVCIAIATEKALKTVQNWFIASLAVSDFLVGLVIMPFSLANELMGYWIFGTLWCDIHSALDVLLCTASINNLCLISLDRYWSVTQAVEYLKKRTPTRAVMMICFVWIFSAAISLPPLIGWKKEESPEDVPTCSLSDNLGYVLYSALGSFYVPAIVMVFVYIRIFMAARSRARRHVKKSRHASEVTNDPPRDKSTTTTTCTSFSNPSPPDRRRDPDSFRFQEHPKMNGSKRESPSTPVVSSMPQIIIEASQEMPLGSPQLFPSESCHPPPVRIPEDPLEEENEDEDEEEEDEEQGDEDDDDGCNNQDADRPLRERLMTSDVNSEDDVASPTSKTPTVSVVIPNPQPPSPHPHQNVRRTSVRNAAARRTRPAFGSTTSLSDSGVGSIKGYEQDMNELYETSSSVKKRRKLRGRLPLRPHSHMIARPLPSDAERQKRRLAKARERRATLILGLIMAAFILAWLPFFVLYVLKALCAVCAIGPTGFATAFWLGYCNSALNPIIYTIFNRDFRRAFKKILLK